MTTERGKPKIELVLGRAGSGKTEFLLQRFIEALETSLLVVTSEGEAEALRELLAAKTDYVVEDFKRRVIPFRELVRDIARRGEVRENPISMPLQRLVVEDICQRYLHSDDFLGQMRGSNGFVSELIARFREWKLACITPERLRESAFHLRESAESDVFVRKTEEFARLFGAYAHFLSANGLSDSEDRLNFATTRLQEGFMLPDNARHLLVDGYFRQIGRAHV